jgi:outer membrane protein
VLQAAQAAVNNREVTLRQIRALAESAMRSTLDVRFAEVTLSQAQLELTRAENQSAEASATLCAALGLEQPQTFTLEDETALPEPGTSAEARIAEAMQKRPDLVALMHSRDAAHRFADSEGRLKMPVVSALGAAGTVPVGDSRLATSYSAAGVNVTIPILNGGLFSARQQEAEQRAIAADQDVRDLAIQISREVRVAWLEANTAWRQIQVTGRLLDQSNEALRLAQARYDLGLGSIVELSQAQLNQTSAQIENASARYEYLSRRSALEYAIGVLQ